MSYGLHNNLVSKCKDTKIWRYDKKFVYLQANIYPIMSYRRLILTLIAAICLLLPTQKSVAVESNHVKAGINCTDDRPQWQDLGMCDVLAVTGGSTLTPPSTVRVVHDSPAGTIPTAQAAQARQYNVQRLLAYSHRRIVSGYIYKIRCLRL